MTDGVGTPSTGVDVWVVAVVALMVLGPLLVPMVLPRAVATIAGITFREAGKQPTTWIVTVAAAALVLLLPVVSLFALGQEAAMLKEMGLNTITLATIMVALFGAANVVTREIEGKTLLTLLAKPVSRSQMIVGKYVGLMALTVWVGVILGVCLQIATIGHHIYATPRGSPLWERANFEYRQSAAETAASPALSTPPAPTEPIGSTDGEARVESDEAKNGAGDFFRIAHGVRIVVATESPAVVLGTYLVLWETAILAAILVAGSTVLPVAANAVLAVVVFIVGHLMDLIEVTLRAVEPIGSIVAVVVPNFRLFEIGETFTRELPLPTDLLIYGTATGAAYTAVALIVGCLLLAHKDLG